MNITIKLVNSEYIGIDRSCDASYYPQLGPYTLCV